MYFNEKSIDERGCDMLKLDTIILKSRFVYMRFRRILVYNKVGAGKSKKK